MAATAPRRSVTAARVVRVRGAARERSDRLATEEPMEIRAGGPGEEPRPLAVTMRTPGHDFELAAGFLLTEGVVADPADIRAVAYCELPDEEQRYNAVTVRLGRTLGPDAAGRSFFTTSSCGICGRASLDAVEVLCRPIGPGPMLSQATLLALPDALRAGQRLFEATGGLHAAGLFDADGRLLALREDVGRHNALDKLIGRAALAGELPLADRVVLVSGRLSFELVQKAAVAGIPVIAAVSAPSSLAVEAAERFGITAVGFLRGDGFNVYAGAERIALGAG